MSKALIIVDAQNDFVEDGALAVTGGQKTMRRLADCLRNNYSEYDLIVTTQDWHIDPKGHFAETPDFIDTWPVHCVAEEAGSEIFPPVAQALGELMLNKGVIVERVFKGEYEAAYSGFEGRTGNKSMRPAALLADLLDFYDVSEVDVTGLATDYCVKATALDAVKEGFETTVLANYCEGIHAEGVKELLEGGFAKEGVKVYFTEEKHVAFYPESFISGNSPWPVTGGVIWLLTPRELDEIPNGVILTCINDTTAVKGLDPIDTDTRGGYIAYGLKVEQFTTNEGK